MEQSEQRGGLSGGGTDPSTYCKLYRVCLRCRLEKYFKDFVVRPSSSGRRLRISSTCRRCERIRWLELPRNHCFDTSILIGNHEDLVKVMSSGDRWGRKVTLGVARALVYEHYATVVNPGRIYLLVDDAVYNDYVENRYVPKPRLN